MTQHDLNIANQSFPNTRSDLNDALVALGTNLSGAAAPSTTHAFMNWADSNNDIMKLRNEANSDWISLYKTDGVQQYASGSTAGLPAFSKSDDVDTGVYFPAADNCSIAAGGSQIINCNSNGFTVNHALNTKVVSKTATYTAANESIILVDASSGAVTINLPAASGLSGRQYTIKKTDSSINKVTVDANASETIDGEAAKILWSKNDKIIVVSDGSNWFVLHYDFASASYVVDELILPYDPDRRFDTYAYARLFDYETSPNFGSHCRWDRNKIGAYNVYLIYAMTGALGSPYEIAIRFMKQDGTVVFDTGDMTVGNQSVNEMTWKSINIASGNTTNLDLSTTMLNGINWQTSGGNAAWEPQVRIDSSTAGGAYIKYLSLVLVRSE